MLFFRANGESTLHVKLYNSGIESVDDLPLKLVVGEQQVAALSIDLPSNKTTEAVINFKVGNKSVFPVYLTIDDYPVEFDNTYYFVLKPSTELKVVEITDGETLGLGNLFSKESLFRFIKYSSGSVNYARLIDANVIILNGLSEVNAALATTITNYLKVGGTVMILPPLSGDFAGYTPFFNKIGIASRITTPTSNKTDLLSPAQDNPFFKGIFADHDRKMQMPSAARSLSWSRASEDILKYRGGSSFMSEKSNKGYFGHQEKQTQY